jgi:hypothetical protein
MLGHIVFREGVLVDPAKVVVILNIPPTTSKQLWLMLGYTRYYHKFIRSYTSIVAPLENLLRKYEDFSYML